MQKHSFWSFSSNFWPYPSPFLLQQHSNHDSCTAPHTMRSVKRANTRICPSPILLWPEMVTRRFRIAEYIWVTFTVQALFEHVSLKKWCAYSSILTGQVINDLSCSTCFFSADPSIWPHIAPHFLDLYAVGLWLDTKRKVTLTPTLFSCRPLCRCPNCGHSSMFIHSTHSEKECVEFSTHAFVTSIVPSDMCRKQLFYYVVC